MGPGQSLPPQEGYNNVSLLPDGTWSKSSPIVLSQKTLPPVTPEQKQKIVKECLKDGVPPTDLARKWGYDIVGIKTWIREEISRNPFNLTKEDLKNFRSQGKEFIKCPTYDWNWSSIMMHPNILEQQTSPIMYFDNENIQHA